MTRPLWAENRGLDRVPSIRHFVANFPFHIRYLGLTMYYGLKKGRLKKNELDR